MVSPQYFLLFLFSLVLAVLITTTPSIILASDNHSNRPKPPRPPVEGKIPPEEEPYLRQPPRPPVKGKILSEEEEEENSYLQKSPVEGKIPQRA